MTNLKAHLGFILALTSSCQQKTSSEALQSASDSGLKQLAQVVFQDHMKTSDGVNFDIDADQLVIDEKVKSAETNLYRGMSSPQKSVADVVKMLALLSPADYIPSWRMSNLKSLRPELSWQEIASLMDQDYAFWSGTGNAFKKPMIELIADAHTGGPEALYPMASAMTAVSFRGLESRFPQQVKSAIEAQRGFPADHIEEGQDKAFFFFDPVMSFSLLYSVAEIFAKTDDSYIIKMNDVNQRRCREASLKRSGCITFSYEFADEAEIGIFGYVDQAEVQALMKGRSLLSKGTKKGEILLINRDKSEFSEVIQSKADGTCPDGYTGIETRKDDIEKLISDGLRASGFTCASGAQSIF